MQSRSSNATMLPRSSSKWLPGLNKPNKPRQSCPPDRLSLKPCWCVRVLKEILNVRLTREALNRRLALNTPLSTWPRKQYQWVGQLLLLATSQASARSLPPPRTLVPWSTSTANKTLNNNLALFQSSQLQMNWLNAMQRSWIIAQAGFIATLMGSHLECWKASQHR